MLAIAVTDNSQVGEARRAAATLGQRLGFGEVELGRASIVVTELATNLLKHGGGGQIVLDIGDEMLTVLALDRGAGADLAACMADGFSTAGTLGHGLGAVRRLSQAFDIVSWRGLGTVVRATVAGSAPRAGPAPAPALPEAGISAGITAGISVPLAGEEVCGDAWSVAEDVASKTVFVVDGLGHGPGAARAAHEAVLQFQRSRGAAPGDIIDAVHHALKPTRGGAVAVARFQADSGLVSFAGLGNIAAALVAPDGKVRRMVSHNGTAGQNARRIATFDYPGATGLLVMHSDGIDSRWSLARYPNLLRAHPLLLAGVLYRDHQRPRDDATVVVARLGTFP